jgi:hypothetical protein
VVWFPNRIGSVALIEPKYDLVEFTTNIFVSTFTDSIDENPTLFIELNNI